MPVVLLAGANGEIETFKKLLEFGVYAGGIGQIVVVKIFNKLGMLAGDIGKVFHRMFAYTMLQ
jgi:hypothetical protein